MPRKLSDKALSPTAISDKLGYTPANETDIQNQINNLIDSAPTALNTLNELAAALGDDANFASTVTNSLAGKVSKSGDTMTGNLNMPINSNINFSGNWGFKTGYQDNTGGDHYYYINKRSNSVETQTIKIHGEHGTVQMPLQPAFLAAGQTGSYAANAVIGFPNKIITSTRSTNFNATTGLFTAPVAGSYYFGYIVWVYSTSTYVQIAFKKNGSDYAPSGSDTLISMNGNPGVSGSAISLTSNVVIELAAGDTMGVGIRSGGLGSSTVSIYGGHSHFYGHLIG